MQIGAESGLKLRGASCIAQVFVFQFNMFFVPTGIDLIACPGERASLVSRGVQ